jgi:hypothetical protein
VGSCQSRELNLTTGERTFFIYFIPHICRKQGGEPGCRYFAEIVSGRLVEVYEYERPYNMSFKVQKMFQDHIEHRSDGEALPRRPDNVKRSIKHIRRLSYCNFDQIRDTKFLTLTFSDNMTDLRQANYAFRKFRERLKYRLGYAPPYLSVPEQRREVPYATMY